MKHTCIWMMLLTTISLATSAVAQQSDWTPQSLAALREGASSKTEFTLDHGMLAFASKLNSDNPDLRRVIAGVSTLAVHDFRYPNPGMYDPDVLVAVKDEYHAAGWTQLVNRHDHQGGPGATNVWIRLDNYAISDIAVLVARSNEVSLILISGSISPIDIVHLGGHFGIPKIEGGVLVPNPERQ